MNILDAHYDFKSKLNKVDSQQYRNLTAPEIDWKLNTAYLMIIKAIANPRHNRRLEEYGFELKQRNIDDIRNLVIDNKELQFQENLEKATVQLPDDYMFHISSTVEASSGKCKNIKFRTTLIQHDDLNNQKDFYKSNFLWRKANIRFNKDGIIVYLDNEFILEKFYLDYIKIPNRVYAGSLVGGSYKMPDGTVLTGDSNFEVSPHLVPEIVDLAVLLTTIDLQIPDLQSKIAKQGLN